MNYPQQPYSGYPMSMSGAMPQTYMGYPDPYQRLKELEAQQAAIRSQQQLQQPQQSQPQPTNGGIMRVDSEKQAMDCPVDFSGSLQMFVLNDESKIFAKRINPSNAKLEFSVYEKRGDAAVGADNAMGGVDTTALISMVGEFSKKLNDIQNEIKTLRKEFNNGAAKSNVNNKSNRRNEPQNALNFGSGSEDAEHGE
jgi:hypothetical protein